MDGQKLTFQLLSDYKPILAILTKGKKIPTAGTPPANKQARRKGESRRDDLESELSSTGWLELAFPKPAKPEPNRRPNTRLFLGRAGNFG
jgi:hypothetical protein